VLDFAESVSKQYGIDGADPDGYKPQEEKMEQLLGEVGYAKTWTDEEWMRVARRILHEPRRCARVGVGK
jgi:hypothetical protein